MSEDDWLGPKTAGLTKVDWSTDGTAWKVIPEVRNVKWKPDKPSKEYGSSSTDGQKRKLTGKHDAFDGSMDLYGDDGEPIDSEDFGIKSGEKGFFRIREANQDGTANDGSGSSGRRWILPVHIDDVSYEHDIEGDDFVANSVNFSQNGDITYPDQTFTP